VNDLATALGDPVTLERGIVTSADGHPEVPQVRTPLDDGTCELRLPPRLGEHTREVLTAAGVDATVVDRIAGPAQSGSSL
jgi:crotonobetainyl-CoA:carnitine CoA-transferase CaiB-like acyl-CoA transferase